MLQKFLSTKEAQLERMLQHKVRLESTLELENSRAEQLLHYKQLLQTVSPMTNSMALNNQANMLFVLNEMQQKQIEKIEQATTDLTRHQSACLTQARFNLGVEKLVDRRKKEAERKALHSEAKIADENATQMYNRFKHTL